MVQFDFDVIVVGGGPAGVITAYSVANSGYSCAILDKKSRDKIGQKNCGDALDKLHVDLVQKSLGIREPVIENGEVRELIRKATFAALDLETKFTTEYEGYLVDRLVYGQTLLKRAEEKGVKILPNSTVRDILIEGDQIVGVSYYDKDRNQEELRAKITIDASGYIGIIRKLIPNNLKNGIDYTWGTQDVVATYREIIELKTENDHPYREEIIIIYHEMIRPPGYVWIFSEGDRKLNIGITWSKSDPYPFDKTMKKIYHDCLDPYFDPSEYVVLHSGGGNIPMRPNFDSLVFNGAMLTGDAGGLVDPTTFEGHGPALESGRLAGITLVKALQKESYRLEDLWDYNIAVMKYPGGMHTQSYLAAQLFRQIGSTGLHFVLDRKIITETELRSVFQQKNKSMNFRAKVKKLFKAFPRWKMMFTIRKYLDLIEQAEKIYLEYPGSPDKLQSWREKRNKKLKMHF